ncbi:MAG: C45 family autoproteolytic acyltransferase/hydrolase [Gimesia sp.]|nr:C45 family autoproteolytic acyltransferase/hydrolase [Gimesia sp.]
MKKNIQFVVTVLTACLSFSGIAQAEGYLTSIGTGTNKIPVVVVKGTPYEMGKKQGELIKEDASRMIHSLMEKVQAGEPERCSNSSLDAAWKSVSRHTDPRFKEELRGFAEGTGMSLKTLQRAHAMPVVMDYSCSGIAAWGSATKDGHLYQTRNLDWSMDLGAQNYPCITVYIPKDGVPHVNVTFAGFIGANTGMNANGIVLSEMGDSPGKDYPFNLDGVHFTTLFRQVMYDADGLDQAIDIFKNARRIKKYHYVVGDGKNLRAVKILAHAPNLMIWKDNDPKDELAPEVMKNLVYQDEGRGAFGPLKKVYGKIGAMEMIDVTCKIPIKGGNILDVVYDATALELWVSYAEKQEEAYKLPFVHFKLNDYLK